MLSIREAVDSLGEDISILRAHDEALRTRWARLRTAASAATATVGISATVVGLAGRLSEPMRVGTVGGGFALLAISAGIFVHRRVVAKWVTRLAWLLGVLASVISIATFVYD